MNKTVTINIAGLVFHIEEDAYERLRSYLETLRMKFSAEEGRDEIMADIESRIAEILTAKKGPAREVVIMSDIEEVISVMGEPEAISDEANTQTEDRKEETGGESFGRRGRRRLFRDPDERVVGGVCSGLAHYFDIDPVWIRLIYVLFTALTVGTGILFYILLMVIIPRAETTAEKLEMHGEPVDVNNIHRSIKEELEEFGERLKDFGKQAKADWGKEDYEGRYRHRFHRRSNVAEDFLRTVMKGVGRVVSFLLVIFGVLLLVGLLTGTFFITDFGPDMIGQHVKSLFDDTSSYYIGIIGGILVFGLPILMMIYSGIIMLFRIKRNTKILGLSLLGVWIIGVVMAVFSIVNIATGFSSGSDMAERVPVLNARDSTFTIKVNIDEDMVGYSYVDEWDDNNGHQHRWKMVSGEDTDLKFGYADLNIVQASGDSIELVVYKKAQGRTKSEAQNRVKSIAYPITQDSNGIIFPSHFTIGDQSWKAQEVDVELRIPVGTEIFIDESCAYLLDDVANISRTYDHDMANRRWIMTSYGLKCVDCNGLGIRKPGERDPNPDSEDDTIITGNDTIIVNRW
jgi:phage shock protein PspC (stress-responsive transcriptional regulator)